MNLRTIISKEKDLRMIWKIERYGRRSYLAGTAHFFPYSFKKSLVKYISSVDTVLLEGPLDERNMNRVVDCGLGEGNGSSLYGALDKKTIAQINKKLASPLSNQSSFASFIDVFKPQSNDLLYSLTIGLKPWMAFFAVWVNYLQGKGWKYSVDLEAYTVAQELGKDIHFLETIDEQIEVLSSIPFERIIHYLKKIEDWSKYTKAYVTCYLKGDMDALMSIPSEFPSRCSTVIDKRDPILYERMRVFFERGNAIAFVGAPHVKEIKKMFFRDGYEVAQVS